MSKEVKDVKDNIEDAIIALANKSKGANNALEAMQYAQATLNATNALLGLKYLEKETN
jgi:hypothetical protein